jgi:hypothetical protein
MNKAGALSYYFKEVQYIYSYPLSIFTCLCSPLCSFDLKYHEFGQSCKTFNIYFEVNMFWRVILISLTVRTVRGLVSKGRSQSIHAYQQLIVAITSKNGFLLFILLFTIFVIFFQPVEPINCLDDSLELSTLVLWRFVVLPHGKGFIICQVVLVH